jgi:hypothetical protein
MNKSGRREWGRWGGGRGKTVKMDAEAKKGVREGWKTEEGTRGQRGRGEDGNRGREAVD